MRKILALALLIGSAALFGGVAVATTDGSTTDTALPSGALYDWYGSTGELSLVGEPGTRYSVYDSGGNAVADGLMDGTHVDLLAGNAGVGPDGIVVFVVIGDDVLAVTDPDWEWN